MFRWDAGNLQCAPIHLSTGHHCVTVILSLCFCFARVRRPMCQEEYIEHYTTKVPLYQRLSKAAAEKKWNLDFSAGTLEKEQRRSNDEDGNAGPLATWR